MRHRKWGVLALVLIASCGSKDKDDGQAGEGPGETTKADKKYEAGSSLDPGPMAKYIGDTAAKLQGIWAMRGEVWEIAGDAITVHTGSGAKQKTLAVHSPCSIKLIMDAPRGGFSFDNKYISWADDGLHVSTNAGVVQGDTMIACFSRVIYVRQGESCTAWFHDMQKPWESEPAECSIRTDDQGRSFFEAQNPRRKQVTPDALAIKGPAMIGSLDQVASKHEDLAAAKAAAKLP